MILKTKMAKVIASAAAVAVLTIGAAGIASAQETPSTPVDPAGTQVQRGQGRHRGGQLLREGGRILLETTATLTGLDTSEITQMLRDGQTLSGIAEANGIDPDALLTEAVTEATNRVNEAVTNGTLTAAQAEELLARLPDAFSNALTSTLQGERTRLRLELDVLALAAEQTGLTAREIGAELRSGSTLGDVLTANGVSPDTFLTDATARLQAALDERVAAGSLTQERADELLQQFNDRLAERLNVSGTI